MKIKVLVVFVFVFFGAANSLADNKYNLLKEEVRGFYVSTVSENTTDSVTVGKYNEEVSSVVMRDEVAVTINNSSTDFKIKSINKSNDRMSFTAVGENDGSVLTLAENNGKVVGSMQVAGKLYKIRPDEAGYTNVIEVSNDDLIDHGPEYYENYNLRLDADAFVSNADLEERNSKVKFTVIVAYTSAFARDAGDVVAYMDLLEEETNLSYSNSLVNASVEIVHHYQTGYRDSGDFYADRSYFSNKKNPEAAELFSLRDTHKADMMIILTGNRGYDFCGIAKEIGATAGTSFAFAREGCAAGYFSFGHEIGHLFGARHIIYTDNSSKPFSYGHGYCNVTSGTWRTIMAYNCPSNSGGPRIQQWSNPDVFIDDEITGSLNVENNAKVLNTRARRVANFR